jgi:hypothetical protein
LSLRQGQAIDLNRSGGVDVVGVDQCVDQAREMRPERTGEPIGVDQAGDGADKRQQKILG